MEYNERRGRNGKGEKARTEGREIREGISRAVSDGFHVSRNGAELAPGGCGWTLMRKVLVVMEEAHERSAEQRREGTKKVKEGESKKQAPEIMNAREGRKRSMAKLYI